MLYLSLPTRWHSAQMIAFHLVHQKKCKQTTERIRCNCSLYPWVLTVSDSIEISILWSCENKNASGTQWKTAQSCLWVNEHWFHFCLAHFCVFCTQQFLYICWYWMRLQRSHSCMCLWMFSRYFFTHSVEIKTVCASVESVESVVFVVRLYNMHENAFLARVSLVDILFIFINTSSVNIFS